MAWLASITSIFGLSSLLRTFFASSYLQESAKLLVLGSIIETGRRLCQWLIERFKFQYCLSARFDEGDPSYEWLVLFLTDENVWEKSRDFIVSARSSKRKWAVTSGPGAKSEGNVDYVPSFNTPRLFRWHGNWVEVTKFKESQAAPYGNQKPSASLQFTIYTRDMTVLSTLVEEARLRYQETNKQRVTIYCIDSPNYAPGHVWNNVKAKYRRPLNSLILAGGVVDSVINDANEFLNMEEWYADAGIPHRRGYLLYGPPGTGKTSTVYAVAGELGLEIYALSLASSFIDDSFLQRAVSSVPKHSLLLIEDIDCAFPSRDGSDDWGEQRTPGARAPPQSRVTLSGLLNVIDGVNSEDGRLFFATTNHIDHLDPALLRPGRIDKRVQYKLATKGQALALYKRFFPESRFANVTEAACAETADRDTAISNDNEKSFYSNGQSRLSALARQFAESVPEDEFSTAELQGYLLMCKMSPSAAVSGIDKWIEHERKGRREREEREKHRKQKARESRLEAETAVAVTDSLVPVQQHKTMTQGDDAAEPTTQSILPSGPDINLDISPQTVSSATALLDDDPDPSKFLHGNRVRMMDL